MTYKIKETEFEEKMKTLPIANVLSLANVKAILTHFDVQIIPKSDFDSAIEKLNAHFGDGYWRSPTGRSMKMDDILFVLLSNNFIIKKKEI